MRPGRLDRILYVGLPDLAGRMDILRIRTRNMAVEPALDLDALADLVRSPSLSQSETPLHKLLVFELVGTDERVLWSRNHGHVPRSCIDCHARGYRRNICECSTSP